MTDRSVASAHSAEETMLRLHEFCMAHIKEATSAAEVEIREILHLEADITSWLTALENQPEAQQLRSAHQDFGLAFYSAMSGLYRQSFASLRSFLEVTCGAVYLSSLEFKRRQWVSGKLDISWTSITSIDEGIYSVAFLREFCPEAQLEREQCVADLKRSYRRCSEYVHGNVSTSLLLPTEIAYRDEVLKEWITVAKSTLISVIHCFTVRYYKDFRDDQRQIVEGCLEEHFAHLESVRTLLQLPIEESK
ncbi:hypothetical protein [Streptomyces sp. NPDC008139]|uniref:hypothetical protein n=1 Tax=Streptomyces sp. NPDC008139 TaxID=3364814 RepID=UPI0036E09674